MSISVPRADILEGEVDGNREQMRESPRWTWEGLQFQAGWPAALA